MNSYMKQIIFILVLVFSFATSGVLFAQDDGNPDLAGLADKDTDSTSTSADDSKKKFSLHGFLRANFVTMKKDKKFDGNFENPLMGSVLQLQFEGNAGDVAHFYAATNIEYNNYDEDNPNDMQAAPFLNIIEAYVDLYPTRWFSLRAGHQLITWGEIDGIMAPTDIICPWNYDIKTTSFEEYKIGVTAVAANFFVAKKHKIELVWIPVFQPSILPKDEIAKKGALAGPGAVPDIIRPEYEISNGEYAGRVSGSIGNNFRYGLAFLYGYDDLPNSRIEATVELFYDRIMIPTIDLSYDIKDLFSVKGSAAFKITDDLSAKDPQKRNSSLEYLAGIESTNIGLGIYLSFYAGQMWVINYTEVDVLNRIVLESYDQDYRYKWLVSSVVQRNFLSNDALELSVRYALSSNPKLSEIDYTINLNSTYKLTSGVSATLGFVIADKIGVVQNTVLLELKYTF